MNKNQMIDFINKEVLPSAEIADWELSKYKNEIIEDILDAIENWRNRKPMDIKMECKILDGILVINGINVRRVANRLTKA